ncbi:MAG: GTPase ObgE [Myxococcales bacterium]|nr:MAG: GTPase ObgE [Myxococcales bacterium]
MKFVDEVTIFVEAGWGGDGCLSFLRAKYVPKGGPNGGPGGDGGDVVLVGDPHMGTLLDLRFTPQQKAERGTHGMGKQMAGARGADKRIAVPLGTVIHDAETGEPLGEIVAAGGEFVVAKGGRGGRGNMSFATATNRAPRRVEPGQPGEARTLKLVLKLMADVGLVGFPNAGKSTFVSAVSRARPKIADYPFTTLVPNLGVARATSGRSFVVADLPGLIEGAADGHGLGHQFLRHIERCGVLLFLLDIAEERGGDPLADYKTLEKELASYSPELIAKPRLVALNKLDLNPPSALVTRLKRAFARRKIPFFTASAATHQGLQTIIDASADFLPATRLLAPSVLAD